MMRLVIESEAGRWIGEFTVYRVFRLARSSLHVLGGQPVSAESGLDDGGHASRHGRSGSAPRASRIAVTSACRVAWLGVAVMLDVGGVAEQGPSVASVVFEAVASVVA